MTLNELNFPSFEIALNLWQSGVLREWKPEDDWEWWWAALDMDRKIEIVYHSPLHPELMSDYIPIYAIPCPSLGEMVERLAEKGFQPFRKTNGDWSIGTYILNNWIPLIMQDTAPNAAARGLMVIKTIK